MRMNLYVAPDGRDTNPGTEAMPLASLAAARDKVRTLIGESDADIHVIFRGGTYRVTETVVFSVEDSSSPDRIVSYEALPGEQPVFSAGIPLTGWRKLEEKIPAGADHLPPAAREHVWVAPLPARPSEGFTYNSLFAGDRRIARARGAGFAFEADESIPAEEWWDTCRVPEGAIENWHDIDNCELVVIPHWTWTMNYLPVKNYNPATRMLKTALPCTYLLRPNGRPESVWVENVLAVLTKPDTWVADYLEGLIYYWPPSGTPEEGIAVPGLTEIVRIEGEIDYDGPADKPVENLLFKGLRFSHGGRFPFHGQTGWGMQHDWEAFDRPTAMVRLRAASGCSFEDCEFSHSDGSGFRFDLTCIGNSVSSSVLEDLGGCGIVLCGYGPGTKDVNTGNTVTNNLIHHTGRITWHSPGIYVWQSGSNSISHNQIHHTPYTGIVVSGRINMLRSVDFDQCRQDPGLVECLNTIRWNEVDSILGKDYEMPLWHEPTAWKQDWDKRKGLLHCRNNMIEYNDIHDVMEIMGDGNGVYISGTGAGNVVRHNAIHDCPSAEMAEALRCDNDQHETTFHGNLIYRIGGMATGITIKGINTITNNIIAEPLSPKTARGLISLEVGPLNGTVISRNILVTNSADQNFYFQRRIHGEGPPPLLRDCNSDNNLYWCTADSSRCEDLLEEERSYGNEADSRAADPQFTDPASSDFSLKDTSPALELGFEPPDVSKIGILGK